MNNIFDIIIGIFLILTFFYMVAMEYKRSKKLNEIFKYIKKINEYEK